MLTPTTKAAKRAEATLKELAAENAALKASPDPQKANELRIRDNLSSTLTRKFGEVGSKWGGAGLIRPALKAQHAAQRAIPRA